MEESMEVLVQKALSAGTLDNDGDRYVGALAVIAELRRVITADFGNDLASTMWLG